MEDSAHKNSCQPRCRGERFFGHSGREDGGAIISDEGKLGEEQISWSKDRSSVSHRVSLKCHVGEPRGGAGSGWLCEFGVQGRGHQHVVVIET